MKLIVRLIVFIILFSVVLTGCGDTPPPQETPLIPTSTPAPTASLTPESTATATPTLRPTATVTPTLRPTATATPTLRPTATVTPTLRPTATATPTPRTENEIEPNETLDTAQSIPVDGTIINASISPAYDDDFYKFTGEVGYTYLIKVIWVSGDNLALNGWWYNPHGIGFGGDGYGFPKDNLVDRINIYTEGGEGGVYYLEIADFDGPNTGEYQISVFKEKL